MRTLTLAALLAFALAAVPPAAGQRAARTIDPGITDGSEQRALTTARNRWKAQGVRSYTYLLSRNCFCTPTTDVRIIVRNGIPAGRVAKQIARQASVPRLFVTIQNAINNKVSRLVVKYGKRGVPRTIFIEASSTATDDDLGFIIRNFAPLRG